MKLLTFILCTMPAALIAGPIFEVTDLGSMGGTAAAGYSINDRGVTVGAANDIFGNVNAFSGSVDRVNFFARNAAAWEINDTGQIAGVQYSGGTSYAMLWSNSGTQMLAGAGSAALGINDEGRVTGMTGSGHMFLTGEDGRGLQDFGTLQGANWSAGHSVNESGQVAGYAMVGSNARAFRFGEDTGYQQLSTLGGRNGYALAINNDGWVVGASQNPFGYLRATLWTHNRTLDLGTLDRGLSSYAYAINQWGAAVGYSQVASGDFHAFLWQDGVLYDLNLLMGDGAGWQLQYAYGINNDGQIVGEGLYNGQVRAFRLDPRRIVSQSFGGDMEVSNYAGSTGTGGNGSHADEGGTYGGGVQVRGYSGPLGAAAVPEPSTYAMVLSGLVLFAGVRARRG